MPGGQGVDPIPLVQVDVRKDAEHLIQKSRLAHPFQEVTYSDSSPMRGDLASVRPSLASVDAVMEGGRSIP